MHIKTIDYSSEETLLKGYLVHDNTIDIKSPAVIVIPAWRGLDDFSRQKAHALAEMGYVGFVADLYGDGTCVQTDEEALALMTPLYLNRRLLRNRIKAAFEEIKSHQYVESSYIGAIGFCFGGLAVMELLKSGVDIAGGVSFHGTYGKSLGNQQVTLEQPDGKIKGALLILQGYEDPFVSKEDINSTLNDFTEYGVDWQMNFYSHAMHAFTNPDANNPEAGLLFDPKANDRSWISMQNFFNEVFKTA